MSGQTNISEIANQICNERSLTLISMVGEGTYKETFQVSDESQNLFALKIYKSGDIDARTEREVDAMLRCNHPGIAKIIHLGTVSFQNNEYLFLLEEFFGGGTLNDRIQGEDLVDRNSIIELGQNLILAVSHMADLNLVHRDIKPANILFREASTDPIITDFGIVRDLQATSETRTWQLIGPCTPFFGAPEQLNNEKRLIDWRTDQFALGVTLALSAFGQHPYMHEDFSLGRTIDEVVDRGETSAYFQNSTEETELTVLQKMVATWPARRYRTTEILLEAWISQER